MTKKDYELFASAIYNHGQFGIDNDKTQYVVDICKFVFAKDNPLFQPEKFERACYEGKHIRKSIKGGL